MNTTIEHDAAVDGMHDPRADSVVREPLDRIFSFQELARLDEALTMSSRETGLRFTLYIGDLGQQTRVRAEEMHGQSGGNPAEAVLIAVSPGQRVVEVVTGAARRPPASRTAPARWPCCR